MSTGKRHWARRALLGLGVVLGTVGVAGYVIYGGGKTLGPGTVNPQPLPAAMVHARLSAELAAEARLDAGRDKQILFGDLHVHTTYSGDAFLRSLPMLQGEGAHPPADACDFARFCSQLDFFALTDHAESITPKRWAEERETVRRCNAVAGDPKDPDLVVFSGWEWTQVGLTPETHYGHKNVIFRDTADEQLPTRVIAATGILGRALRTSPLDRRTALYPLQDFARRQAYLDLVQFQRETTAVPLCPEGVDERALPADCREDVATPRELFAKLASWGFDALVIPHGTTWGFYTPAGSTWKKQLTGPQRDPARQFLMEVYSGHGNSEEYRPWDGVEKDASGASVCPAPVPGYEACCWRAGEIIRGRCGDAPAEECERRVREARANHLAAGAAAHLTVPGASVEDWGDCGQCRDCFLPTYNYRPGGSAQLVLATTDFEDPAHPRNQTWGFLASSDNHSARPGTGYKEYGRHWMTETAGAEDETWHERIVPEQTRDAQSKKVDPKNPMVQPFLAVDVERQASFFLTGGLVAVHSEGRNREAIWDALKRREVYGTSGKRSCCGSIWSTAPRRPPWGARSGCTRRRASWSARPAPSCSSRGASPSPGARPPSGWSASVAASATARARSGSASPASRSCASGRSTRRTSPLPRSSPTRGAPSPALPATAPAPSPSTTPSTWTATATPPTTCAPSRSPRWPSTAASCAASATPRAPA